MLAVRPNESTTLVTRSGKFVFCSLRLLFTTLRPLDKLKS